MLLQLLLLLFWLSFHQLCWQQQLWKVWTMSLLTCLRRAIFIARQLFFSRWWWQFQIPEMAKVEFHMLIFGARFLPKLFLKETHSAEQKTLEYYCVPPGVPFDISISKIDPYFFEFLNYSMLTSLIAV